MLVTAGGAVSAAALGGAAIGGLGLASAHTAPSREQDLRILTFLLGLQRIERAFYAAARSAGNVQGDLAEYLELAASQEHDHVELLERTLGVRPAEPRLHFEVDNAFSSAATFIAKAVALEDTVVAAINGQVTNLTPERLPLAFGLVSVEARHAAWIRDIGHEPEGAPATDAPMDPDAVRNLLRREGLLT
jgi:hypothetical protein